MDTIKGYEVKNKKGMSHWESLLEEWLLLVDRYCRTMKGCDAPYIYNERANISILAGAAWRCGRIALEEFQEKKGYRNKIKKLGRVDLWLSNEIGEEYIEAKYKWISMGSNQTNKLIDQAMVSARQDAKKSRGNSSSKAIGVGFFPVYRKNNLVKDIDLLINNTINDFYQYDFHAIAWSFPKQMRNFIFENNNILPGLFLVANNIEM
jgi:hypothetical protein